LKIVDSVNKTPPALYAGEDGIIPPIKTIKKVTVISTNPKKY
jgi:hypothetical protein